MTDRERWQNFLVTTPKVKFFLLRNGYLLCYAREEMQTNEFLIFLRTNFNRKILSANRENNFCSILNCFRCNTEIFVFVFKIKFFIIIIESCSECCIILQKLRSQDSLTKYSFLCPNGTLFQQQASNLNMKIYFFVKRSF